MIDLVGDWMLEVVYVFGIFFNLENVKKLSVLFEMIEVYVIVVN